MIKMKIVKIISLILLALILATYYPLIASRLDNHTFYSYKDITGQEWEISKVKAKWNEYPINIFNGLSGVELQQYSEIKNEIEKNNKIIYANQQDYNDYNDGSYTGGLTFDDLDINGGSALKDWEVTKILHEEAQKRLQNQHDLYVAAIKKDSDLKDQMDGLSILLTKEAWDLRNTINNVRVFSIMCLLLLIFAKKILKISKKTFAFIIND